MQDPHENLPERVCAFIENLTITVGGDAGKPFVLRDFQRAFIEDLFTPYLDEDGQETFPTIGIFSGARKIGKTTFMAALALAALIGPLSEANGQIIIAANSRDQAKNLFDEILRMIRADPDLQEIVGVVPTKHRAYVLRSDVSYAGSVARVISAEAHTAHGLNPSLILADETGQAKNRDLIEALMTSQAARARPLFVSISTQNGDPNHFFSQMVEDGLNSDDPSTICHLFSATPDCDIGDEEEWYRANPALGDYVPLSVYRKAAARAARLPLEELSFRRYFLNQMVSNHSGLIVPKDWQELADPQCKLEDGEPIILALDMSSTKDLTALTAISLTEDTRVDSWFWKPDELVADASKEDRVPYDVWARQGHLLTCQGRAINPHYMADKITDLAAQYDVRALVIDRFKTDELLRLLEERGLALNVVPWGQGWVSMSPAIDAFEREVLLRTLSHPNHPVLNFCVLNAVAKQCSAGNRTLDKAKSRQRIDGAVTLTMAIGYKAKMREEAALKNPFDEDDEFSLLDM